MNEKHKKLSCIVPYAYSEDIGRQEALKNLMNCFEVQTFRSFELIVLEHVKNDEEGKFPYKDKADKYIKLVDPRHFNKAWCCNVGAQAANTENLLFHDADSLFGNTFLQDIWDFIPHHNLFSCWDRYVLLPGKDNPVIRMHNERSISCLIACWYCHKDYFFNSLGAYNEDYFGYGREDGDIWRRANYLCDKKIPYMNYSMVHHYHDWHPKNGANPLNRDDDHLNEVLRLTDTNPQKVINDLVNNNNKLGKMDEPFLLYPIHKKERKVELKRKIQEMKNYIT